MHGRSTFFSGGGRGFRATAPDMVARGLNTLTFHVRPSLASLQHLCFPLQAQLARSWPTRSNRLPGHRKTSQCAGQTHGPTIPCTWVGGGAGVICFMLEHSRKGTTRKGTKEERGRKGGGRGEWEQVQTKLTTWSWQRWHGRTQSNHRTLPATCSRSWPRYFARTES